MAAIALFIEVLFGVGFQPDFHFLYLPEHRAPGASVEARCFGEIAIRSINREQDCCLFCLCSDGHARHNDAYRFKMQR